MTSRKHPKRVSQAARDEFWASVDMNEYYMSDIYREKVDKEWDQHRYLQYQNEKRTHTK